MMRSVFAAAAFGLLGMFGTAQAATLNGAFSLTIVHALNQTGTQSQATDAAFNEAYSNALNNVDGYTRADIAYSGELDFSTVDDPNTTIADWLATGTPGGAENLGAFGDQQLSKGNIGDGTATTTFFFFTSEFLTEAGDITVTHDDGVLLYDGPTQIGGFAGPNGERETEISGFDGGRLQVLYVATNSNPSILKVDVAAVPLPAALPLLAVGLAGLGLIGRRRKAA